MVRVADQQHLDWMARSFGRPDYAPLGPADIELIRSVGEVIQSRPGGHLFREGDPAVAAFVVESGEVEVYRGSGHTRRIISRVGPGSVLGDIAMFQDVAHLSSAMAVGPVHAFRFERNRLLPELARHPAVCLRWLVAGLRQLEDTQRRVISLMQKTVLCQVADLLVEEAGGRRDITLSQSTIAALLGVSRQSVNEALGRLRDQRLIETGYRRIRVLDPAKLQMIATG